MRWFIFSFYFFFSIIPAHAQVKVVKQEKYVIDQIQTIPIDQIQLMKIPNSLEVKFLVEDNLSKRDPGHVVVKLRWSLNPEAFTWQADSVRFRFPESGVTVYRKRHNQKTFRKIGNYMLPSSESDLISKVKKIDDSKLRSRLLDSGSKNLTEEGEDFLEAIESSKDGKNEYDADPMQMLMLASLDPDIAGILGMSCIDSLRIQNQDTVNYALAGRWKSSTGPESIGLDSIVTQIVIRIDDPLTMPIWISAQDSLEQIREMTFKDSVVYYQGDKAIKKAASTLYPESPVIRLRWLRNSQEFVGYHIDRTIVYEDGDRSPRVRVSVIKFPLDTLKIGNYSADLDSQVVPQKLKQSLIKLGLSFTNEPRTWIGEEGMKWFVTGDAADPANRILLTRSDDNLIVYELRPSLYLSNIDTTDDRFGLEPVEEFFDDLALSPGQTANYRITAVDIFGRESDHSGSRSILIQPIPIYPLPPQNVGMESFHPSTKVRLSKPCPSVKNDTTFWISPADLNQPNGTSSIGIKLKWEWTEQMQRKYKVSYFNIYRDTVSCVGNGLDDDHDGRFDEEYPNEYDDDGDFLIDEEDFAVSGQKVASRIGIRSGKTQYEKTFIIDTAHPVTKKEKPVMYYYFSITTVSEYSKGIDDDHDGIADEDTLDLSDNDVDGRFNEDTIYKESMPSIPVMAYVVDKVPPKMVSQPCTNNSSWLSVDRDTLQEVDWEGKLTLYLDWTAFEAKLPDKDIEGYNLYRTIDSPSSEYMRLNRSLLTTTVYADHIESRAKNAFYYKIEAVDHAGNVSAKSDASCPVTLPDKIEPIAPIIMKVKGGDERITLEFEPSMSSDVAYYQIYRDTLKKDIYKSIQNKKKRLNNAPLQAGQALYSFIDSTDVKAGLTYYYVVEAVDKSLNIGYSKPAAGRAYDHTPPEPPGDLKADIIAVHPKRELINTKRMRMMRITPSKVGAGEDFTVQVRIHVKESRVEYISLSEDPRGPQASETLLYEAHNPPKDTVMVYRYQLSVLDNEPPGTHRIMGTGKTIQRGKEELFKDFISEIQIVPKGQAKSTVKLSWKLPEKNARAAVWRCSGDASTGETGAWRMIAPVQPPDTSTFTDKNVILGQTYSYKVMAYDEVGNEGSFSKIITVQVK